MERSDTDRIDIAYLHDPEEYDLESGVDHRASGRWRRQGATDSFGPSGSARSPSPPWPAAVRTGLCDLIMVAGRLTLLDSSGAELLGLCRGTRGRHRQRRCVQLGRAGRDRPETGAALRVRADHPGTAGRAGAGARGLCAVRCRGRRRRAAVLLAAAGGRECDGRSIAARSGPTLVWLACRGDRPRLWPELAAATASRPRWWTRAGHDRHPSAPLAARRGWYGWNTPALGAGACRLASRRDRRGDATRRCRRRGGGAGGRRPGRDRLAAVRRRDRVRGSLGVVGYLPLERGSPTSSGLGDVRGPRPWWACASCGTTTHVGTS